MEKESEHKRDSFIFYRSFYEAIHELKDDIKLEVFTAITEYALYGKVPEDLKPVAKGMLPSLSLTSMSIQPDTKTERRVAGNLRRRSRLLLLCLKCLSLRLRPLRSIPPLRKR